MHLLGDDLATIIAIILVITGSEFKLMRRVAVSNSRVDSHSFVFIIVSETKINLTRLLRESNFFFNNRLTRIMNFR